MTDNFKTIPDLRIRIISILNDSINILNRLNDIIFEDIEGKPNFIPVIEEELNNISLEYLINKINLCRSFMNEIKEKKSYIYTIRTKNNECHSKLKEVLNG